MDELPTAPEIVPSKKGEPIALQDSRNVIMVQEDHFGINSKNSIFKFIGTCPLECVVALGYIPELGITYVIHPVHPADDEPVRAEHIEMQKNIIKEQFFKPLFQRIGGKDGHIPRQEIHIFGGRKTAGGKLHPKTQQNLEAMTQAIDEIRQETKVEIDVKSVTIAKDISAGFINAMTGEPILYQVGTEPRLSRDASRVMPLDKPIPGRLQFDGCDSRFRSYVSRV